MATPDVVEVIVEGPPGPSGESQIMAAHTFLGNPTGTGAFPDDFTAQEMGVISAVDTQTYNNTQKTKARENIEALGVADIVAGPGILFS